MLKWLLFTGAVLCPLVPAYAQHAVVLQKLTEWNQAAPAPDEARIKAEIIGAAKSVYGDIAGCAASAVTIEQARPATAERYVFSAVLGGSMRNAWTVVARLPGCDSAPVRFMTMQAADGALRTIRVNRGQSHAWDSLIADALPLAAMGVHAAMKRQGIACDAEALYKLGVTRVVSDEGLAPDVFGVRYSGAWSEVWPITMCGRTAEVTVTFNADGDGGAYIGVPGDKLRIVPQ